MVAVGRPVKDKGRRVERATIGSACLAPGGDVADAAEFICGQGRYPERSDERVEAEALVHVGQVRARRAKSGPAFSRAALSRQLVIDRSPRESVPPTKTRIWLRGVTRGAESTRLMIWDAGRFSPAYSFGECCHQGHSDRMACVYSVGGKDQARMVSWLRFTCERTRGMIEIVTFGRRKRADCPKKSLRPKSPGVE